MTGKCKRREFPILQDNKEQAKAPKDGTRGHKVPKDPKGPKDDTKGRKVPKDPKGPKDGTRDRKVPKDPRDGTRGPSTSGPTRKRYLSRNLS